MRHDRLQIFELRKQGKTYREIEKMMNISRSTLCNWFKNEDWSNHIKRTNTSRHIGISLERLKKLNDARRLILDKRYKDSELEAVKEFEVYKIDPLFSAGLMLYAGEGDKMTKGIIRLANIDFSIHRVFIRFLEKFAKIKRENIKISILLYPDLDIETCKKKWSEELNISINNFHKPQVIQGRSKIKRLHFGVGSTIISNSFLKKKILKWIEMSKEMLST